MLSFFKTKINIRIAIASTFMMLCCAAGAVIAPTNSYAESLHINFSTSKIAQKDRAAMTRNFQRRVANVNRALKKAAGKGRKPMNITSINVVDDCSASVTCGDGTKLSCSIQGPGSCESGTFSVACISANSEEHDACGPTN